MSPGASPRPAAPEGSGYEVFHRLLCVEKGGALAGRSKETCTAGRDGKDAYGPYEVYVDNHDGLATVAAVIWRVAKPPFGLGIGITSAHSVVFESPPFA